MRLIDADFFEEKIKESIKWVDRKLEKDRFSEGCKASLKDIMSTLRNYTPTIDAVPVVHGHWVEEVKDCDWFYYVDFKCSNCKNEFFGKTKYCTNCGAKMDETE